MNIVVLDGHTANPGDLSWSRFEALGTLTVHDRTAPAEIARRAAGADILLTNKTVITKELLDGCPRVRYIGVLATGYNVVDLDAAKARGILVTNIPNYSTPAVAQMVFSLLLEICHRTGHHDRAVHEGRWQQSPDFAFWDYPLIELSGKTLGIFGLGQIGRAVARIGNAMGMKAIAHGGRATPGEEEPAERVPLEELFARSDVLSLHAPLNAQTQHLIRAETLAQMKPGAILINTARGGLVNERDLADALNSGRLFAAGVDVVSAEPIRADNPLLTAKNCVITPHIAWASFESRKRLLDIAADNLEKFLSQNPVNVVNP